MAVCSIPRLRRQLLGREVGTIPAILNNYERRRGRYFYLASSPGSLVQGLVVTELTKGEFEMLDRYEDVPTLYIRDRIRVESKGVQTECWVYLPAALQSALDTSIE
jgi:gamma-glutamylcyclotransferase (GGCT)/AIG2-like uncharacterized protein YtfP